MVESRRISPPLLLQIVLLMACISWVKAEDNASILADYSTTQTTPGQLITITVRIYYDDGVEMLFRPAQQPWGKMQLLEYSQSVPEWQEKQWMTLFTLQTAAPIAGEYQFPPLTANVFREADHWQVSTTTTPLVVLTAFPQGNLRLQDLEPLPATSRMPDYLFWVIFAPFFLIFMGLWLLKGQRLSLSLSEFTSASELAKQAEETGYMDWEGLRQWLVTTTGSDPLGKLTTVEPLLHDYQSLRFKAHSSPRAFISLCRRCQERWS